MNIKNYSQMIAVQLLTSRRLRRFRHFCYGQPTVITFYHRLDDPYSYLLLKVLPDFVRRFRLKVTVVLLHSLPEGSQADPERLAHYALMDAARLAQYYHIEWNTQYQLPPADGVALINRALLSTPAPDLEHMLESKKMLWDGKATAYHDLHQNSRLISNEEAKSILQKNCAAMLQRGHYQAAMIYCAGEWYWGLDRLGYLEQRLLHYQPEQKPAQYRQHYQPFIHHKPQYSNRSLTLYFSFRSPYSYLALERAKTLCSTYGLELDMRPVLPMVMRGLPVPRAKRLYIVQDAAREAQSWNIPFGKLCDPLGKGVERAMALFPYAQEKGLAYPYSLGITRAVWSQAADISNDESLQEIIEEVGLCWRQCQLFLADEKWRSQADKNREHMLELGCWGVPTMVAGGCVVWGQDRFWALAQALEQ